MFNASDVRSGAVRRTVCLCFVAACCISNADAAGPLAKQTLIIAISEYPAAKLLPSLPGVTRDAKRLERAFVAGGYRQGEIRLMYDGAATAKDKPTRQNILQALDQLADKANNKEQVIVLFTGHGMVFEKTSYLCPSETTDAVIREEATGQLIAVHEITKRLARCSATQKLLVVDSCRDESRSRTNGFTRLLSELPDGMWLINSCSEGQQSYISSKIRAGEAHSIFSYFLCEGISGKADLAGDNDGRVDVFELYAYAYRKTDQESRRMHVEQTPELFGGLAAPVTVTTFDSAAALEPVAFGNAKQAKQQVAELLASQSVVSIRSVEQRFAKSFQMLPAANREQALQQLHESHHRELGYILGNSLRRAIHNDPACQLAHRGRAMIFRTCGRFAEAQQEFQRIGEPLELFARADDLSLTEYFRAKKARPDAQPPVPKVLLRKEPDSSAQEAGHVRTHDKLRIGRIVQDRSSTASWLSVTAVNDRQREAGGWIRDDEVVWLEGAVDLYTPVSPLRQANDRVPPVLAGLQQVSRYLKHIAAQLGGRDRPQNNAPEGAIVEEIFRGLRQAGVQLPRGQKAAQILDVVNAFVEEGIASETALLRATQASSQRQRLSTARSLDRVEERPVRLSLDALK